MQWQPIDTAPLDGTELVLWCEKSQLLVLVGRYSPKRSRWEEYRIDGDELPEYAPIESWVKPTHWFKIEPPDNSLDTP